jgi:hypothetical protein
VIPVTSLVDEFLARVIRLDAVQRHRAKVTDVRAAEFFASGRRPGPFGDFMWSLDAPAVGDWGLVCPLRSGPP